MRYVLVCCIVWVAILAGVSMADDWPQWLGPQRDSVYREEGIVERFPEDGLKVKWRTPVGWGYAGPAVAGGRVYLMDYQLTSGRITNNAGAVDRLEGKERVLCLDAQTGELLWKHEYDRPYAISFGGGPRVTPTVDGDMVFALGAEGNLWCLDARSGKLLWSKDFAKDYGAKTPMWGVAAHPLVDGDVLYCLVGGEKGVALALDKRTGKELWWALSAKEQGYCPPTMIDTGAGKQLLIWHPQSLNSLDPATGRLHWSVPLAPAYGMSIATPRMSGTYLFATGIGTQAVLLKLHASKPAVSEVWRGQAKTAVYCATSTPFINGDTIYGCDESGALVAVRLADGNRLWQTTEPTLGKAARGRYGTAFIVKHKNRFFLFSETGDLILARLSPEGYQELSRFHVLEPTNSCFGRPVVWSHPAFAQRCCFARNDKEIVCVDLAAQ